MLEKVFASLWLVMLQQALPAVIYAIRHKVGKEIVEAMQAGIDYATTLPLSGKEQKQEALYAFYRELADVRKVSMEVVVAGLPWFINLLFEALVAKMKVGELLLPKSDGSEPTKV